MHVFNPTAVAAAVQATAMRLQAEGDTPAALVRVQGANLEVAVAVGTADLTTGAAATPDMRFEVGSQTKSMTAVVILQLVAEGRLGLDDRLADHLDAAFLAGIEHADTATIRSALAMTSGIQSYTEMVRPDGSNPWVDLVLANLDTGTTQAMALDLVRGVDSTATPGAFDYSNTNYALLGAVIVAATGQPLAQVFEERVFGPAGMTRSDLEGIAKSGDGLHGYLKFDGVERLDTTFLPADLGAEGGVVATTADLIRFFDALLTGDALLDGASLAAMDDQAVIGAGGGVRQTFGLGLGAFEFEGGDRFVGFSGATAGHVSATYRAEGTGLIASAAANEAQTPANPDGAVISLLQSLADDPAWAPVGPGPVRVESASAADVALAGPEVAMTVGDATLRLDLDLAALTTARVGFADGSVLVVGDNRAGTAADDAANVVNIARQFGMAVAARDNQILGLGGDDRARAGHGDDRLNGGAGNDHLWGGAGRDLALGGEGDDWLSGGRGADLLGGGAGADVFDFDLVTDIGRGRGTRDVILDWGAGDTLDLRGIDADATRDGNQAFRIVDAYTGTAGDLRIWAADRTYVEGDVSGDGRADFRIEVTGVQDLADQILL